MSRNHTLSSLSSIKEERNEAKAVKTDPLVFSSVNRKEMKLKWHHEAKEFCHQVILVKEFGSVERP